MAYAPHYARIISSSPAPLSAGHLTQLAVTPPIAHMRIQVPSLGWVIDVHATTAGGVTVNDVLNTLYTFFQRQVHQSEWALVSDSTRAKVGAAFKARCDRLGPAYSKTEYSYGVKRIDFLVGVHGFLGLSPTRETATWVLCLGAAR